MASRWLLMAEAAERLVGNNMRREDAARHLRAACSEVPQHLPVPRDVSERDMAARCVVVCARLRVDPAPLLQHCGGTLAAHVAGATSTHMLSLLWSLAKVRQHHAPLFKASRDALCCTAWGKRYGWTMVPERVNAAAYSFAAFLPDKKQARDPPLAAALSEYYAAHFEQCTASGSTLVTSLHYLDALGGVAPPLARKVLENVTGNPYFLHTTLAESGSRAGVMLPAVVAGAAAGVRNDRQVAAALEALAPLALQGLQALRGGRAWKFDWALVAGTLQGYHRCRVAVPLLYEAAEEAILHRCHVVPALPEGSDAAEGGARALTPAQNDAFRKFVLATSPLNPLQSAGDDGELARCVAALGAALRGGDDIISAPPGIPAPARCALLRAYAAAECGSPVLYASLLRPFVDGRALAEIAAPQERLHLLDMCHRRGVRGGHPIVAAVFASLDGLRVDVNVLLEAMRLRAALGSRAALRLRPLPSFAADLAALPAPVFYANVLTPFCRDHAPGDGWHAAMEIWRAAGRGVERGWAVPLHVATAVASMGALENPSAREEFTRIAAALLHVCCAPAAEPAAAACAASPRDLAAFLEAAAALCTSAWLPSESAAALRRRAEAASDEFAMACVARSAVGWADLHAALRAAACGEFALAPHLVEAACGRLAEGREACPPDDAAPLLALLKAAAPAGAGRGAAAHRTCVAHLERTVRFHYV